MHNLKWISLFWIWGILFFVTAACQNTPDRSNSIVTRAPTVQIEQPQSFTPFPTIVMVEEVSAPTIPAQPSMVPSTITTVIEVSRSPVPTISHSPSKTPISLFVDHYLLSRPILQEEGYTHWIDRTYPYGGTQLGTREVHLGVEFVNGRFTSVLATADGIVFYAGSDENVQFGPFTGYYGNLVVIQHPFLSPDGYPVFTLYAHLQDMLVTRGEHINEGQPIGRVGDSGIAVGPHLHFEVRVGDVFDYHQTRNPDLWITPYSRYGTLAGYVARGDSLENIVIQVRSENYQRETAPYSGEMVNSDPVWNENFTIGDLPIGEYTVLIGNGAGRVLYRDSVVIQSGITTFLQVNP